jgi:hypothetical protein
MEMDTMKKPTIFGIDVLDFLQLIAIGIPLLIVTAPLWIVLFICGVDIKEWVKRDD